MLEGKRQKQVAAVIQKDLNDIFQKLGLNMIQGGMVSIASVKITPDLHEARVYLSFFKVNDTKQALKTIEDKAWEIKKLLTSSVRHQFRTMPVLSYFIDDTLEYVDKMEKLFKDIHEQDKKISGDK
ncbi:MAG: ribosome-binding factor A [Ferruginibacter sp.]|nr:ribosome-binding factor A [Ferruginibacter sp.]